MINLPDFTGLWRTPGGIITRYFYITKKGIIIDRLGVAEVKSIIIDQDQVNFSKLYLSPKEGITGLIIFEGLRDRSSVQTSKKSIYYGSYRFENEGRSVERKGRGFSLEDFSKIKTQELEKVLEVYSREFKEEIESRKIIL